jgi:multiple antibiotic resistance protein
MIEVFLGIFVVYFVVIDPIGTVPLFVALTGGMSSRAKLRMAIEGPLIAGAVLIFFAVFGAGLLSYLGISLIAFKIGGGLLLFQVAVDMLSSRRLQRKQKTVSDTPKQTAEHAQTMNVDQDSNKGQDISEMSSVYPLAIPLLAGPAAIVSVMMVTSDTTINPETQIIGLIALCSTLALSSILLCLTAVLGRVINEKAADVVTRVMAILLAALSVQYVLEGLAQTGLLNLT